MLSIDTRFGDALAIWEQAEASNGLVLHFDTQDAAIHANFRLQRARKALRDRDGMTIYDLFIVQVPPHAQMIRIMRRPAIAARITTLDGAPVDTTETAPESLRLEEDC